jgi:lysine/ornithine N-monooxygenase
LKALIYVADILELALKDGEHIDRNEYQSFAEWASSTCMQGKYGMIDQIDVPQIDQREK